MKSIHWANIRPTSTENDSGVLNSADRLRRREKLASLKQENNNLKSKLKATELKLKTAEEERKRYKVAAGISTTGFLILLFAGLMFYFCQFEFSAIDSGAPDIRHSTDGKNESNDIRDYRIIARDEWADKELKANISDLEPLPLPLPRGVIAHHTSVDSNRCFSYGESKNIFDAFQYAFDFTLGTINGHLNSIVSPTLKIFLILWTLLRGVRQNIE